MSRVVGSGGSIVVHQVAPGKTTVEVPEPATIIVIRPPLTASVKRRSTNRSGTVYLTVNKDSQVDITGG